MIKLFSLKQEKEKEEAAAGSGTQKVAPGLIRMQKGAPTPPALADPPAELGVGGRRSTCGLRASTGCRARACGLSSAAATAALCGSLRLAVAHTTRLARPRRHE